VNFLLSDALALILSGANLLSWLVAVLDEGSPADCNSHVLGSLAVLDEAVLYIVLLTVFFLCCLISGLERLGASPIVAVLTPHHNLPLRPLFHEHLVYTPLASCIAGSNFGEWDA